MTGIVIGAIFMFSMGWLASMVLSRYERRRYPRAKDTEFRVFNRRVR